MTVRTKTLLIIGITIACLMGIVFAVAQTVLMRGISDLEDQSVREDVVRARNILDGEINTLDSLGHEWASRDDTYAFAADGNLEYVRANLTDSTFQYMQLSLFMLISSDGKTIFNKAYDLQNRAEIPVAGQISDQTAFGGPLLPVGDTAAHRAGLVGLSDGPMFISARPILTSDGEGPSRGTLVMGRYLDQAEMARLGGLAQFSLSIHNLNSEMVPDTLKAEISRLPADISILVQAPAPDLIQGYTVLKDIRGQTLLLQVAVPRDLYQTGYNSINYFVVSVLLIGIIFIVLTVLLLEKLVLSRLGYLSHGVREISDSGDISRRLVMPGKDELAELTRVINEMLEKLEQYGKTLREKNQQLDSQNEQLKAQYAELVRQKQELMEKTEELAAASEMKSQFLASMSHELRTPLNAVIGFSELMLDGIPGQINEEQRQCLNDILSSGQHLLNLINDVLDLSKVEAGKMELRIEELDLAAAVNEASGAVKPMLEANHHTLSLNLPPALPQVRADKGKLRQILLNLLSNAIKFTAPGGKLRVEAVQREGLVELAVIDNGIGIRAEDQKKIFAAFTQVDNLPDGRREGTGLGLALSKQLIEMMGGRIWVESKYGEGSRFAFNLQVVQKEAPAEGKEGRGKEDGAGKLILVIDDDRKARSLLRAWLREEGYTVKEAAGGNEGIKLAAELSPALIILDILMPDKNGWQVLEELKEDPRTAAIPVMIASVAEEQGLGFSLGAIDYFVKPIDRSKLMDKLADLGLKTGEAVLVIEDNPSDLNLVAALLETEKLHVLRASLGELGLRMARKARPGVIVLDLMLPDMSGFEVIDCLHQDPETSNIPIIVLTMKDLNPEELHVLHQQTAAVLHKAAFKRQDFMAEVTRALRQTHRSGPKE